MKIRLDTSSIKESRWYEYVERFVFGGIITAATGLIAKKFGPEVAGLFLAFPAIFPATATLIAKHEHEKKEQAGLPGARSGRAVAAVDSAGTAMGTLGLIAFGLFVWKLLPHHSAVLVLLVAIPIWLALLPRSGSCTITSTDSRETRHAFMMPLAQARETNPGFLRTPAEPGFLYQGFYNGWQ